MLALVGLTIVNAGGAAAHLPGAATAAAAFSFALYYVALTGFCRAFLTVRSGRRVLDAITLALLAAVVVAIFALRLHLWHAVASMSDEPFQLALIAVLFARGVIARRQGYAPARFYLIAFYGAVAGMVTSDLNAHRLLFPQRDLHNAFDVGVAFEALLFALALADRNRALSKLVGLDGLTGIANRRSFDAALVRSWDRARRSGDPIGLLMIDVDFFKKYNDGFGHQAGDEVLRRVAVAVEKAVLRPDDVAARYGGEEFAIVLPLAEAEAARLIGERVRANVRELAIPYAGTPAGVVTVSVGVASLRPEVRRDPSTLVSAADTALYRAKREGRDRVVVAPLEPASTTVAPLR